MPDPAPPSKAVPALSLAACLVAALAPCPVWSATTLAAPHGIPQAAGDATPPPALADLQHCATDEDLATQARLDCVHALKDGGAEGVDALLELLDHDEVLIRLAAARALDEAPAERVRAPLLALLGDVEPVRLAALATLLATQPEKPEASLEAVVGSLCTPWANGIHLVRSLLHRRSDLVDDAVPLVIELLRGDDERCHLWAAVTLGEFAPLRARPALPLIRQALLGESAALRRVAAAAISEMGPGALALRPDLLRAAEEDPSLEDYLWRWWNSPWRLEHVSVEDLKLVALTYEEADAPRAFVLHVEGRVWELKPGDQLQNAEIIGVEGEAVAFSGRRVTDDFSEESYRGRLPLFGSESSPEPLPEGSKDSGYPTSVDFVGSTRSFTILAGMAFDLNAVLEAGTEGEVRVSARQEPWDGVVGFALEANDLGYLIDGRYLRIAAQDAIESVQRASGTGTASTVTLDILDGNLRELVDLYNNEAGGQAKLLGAASPRVTTYVKEVPWDEVLEVLVASLKGRFRRIGDRIEISGLEGER